MKKQIQEKNKNAKKEKSAMEKSLGILNKEADAIMALGAEKRVKIKRKKEITKSNGYRKKSAETADEMEKLSAKFIKLSKNI